MSDTKAVAQAWPFHGRDTTAEPKISVLQLKARVDNYNRFTSESNLSIKVNEVNGDHDLLLEGRLRIFWGVNIPIHFKKLDETSIVKDSKIWRRSFVGVSRRTEDNKENNEATNGSAVSDVQSPTVKDPGQQFRYNTVGGSVACRRRKVNKRVQRRLSMINGHLYDLQTSIFTPTEGSVTAVNVTSKDQTPAVIKMLLSKFKVENNPEEFCLCTVKKTGEMRVLKETDYPLIERVLIGPFEEEAKLVLQDRHKSKDISDEVAHFMSLPEPVLVQFLQKLEEEELMAKQSIILKYENLRKFLEKKLTNLETPDWID